MPRGGPSTFAAAKSRMASNLRRTDDLQRLRARELVLQNADGSFPTQGQVMIAGDGGRVEFTPVFSLDTSGNMMVPGNIYVGGNVIATGLYVDGPFSVNISHIIAGDLSAGSAVVGVLDASAATMTDLTVDRVHVLDYIDDAQQVSSLNTNLVRAVQVLAGSEDPNDQPAVGVALDVSGSALVRAGLTVEGVLSAAGLDMSGDLGIGGNLTVDGSANVVGTLYVGPNGDRGLIAVEDASGTEFKMRNLAAQGELFASDAGSGDTRTPILQCDATTNSFNIYDSSRAALLAHIDACGAYIGTPMDVSGYLEVHDSANVYGRLYVSPGNAGATLLAVDGGDGAYFKFRNIGKVGAILSSDGDMGPVLTPTMLFDSSENQVRLVSTDTSAHPILVADGDGVDVGGVLKVSPQVGISVGQLTVEDTSGTHLKLYQTRMIGTVVNTISGPGTPIAPLLEFNGIDGALRVRKLGSGNEAMRIDASGTAFSGEVDIVGPLYVGPNGDRGLITVEDSSGTEFKMRNKNGQGELFVSDIVDPFPTLTPILQCDATTNSFNIYDSSRNTLLLHIDASSGIQCNSITLLNGASSGVLTYDAGELKVNGVPVGGSGGGGVSTTPLEPMTVAVGSGGQRITYNASTNSLSGNWSIATLPGEVSTVYCVEWNGKYWLALTNAGALHSLEGITWTKKVVQRGDPLPATPTTATLASNGDMWVAGYSGSGGASIYASTDGITWYAATATQTATYGFFWMGTFWFAMGTASDPSGADAIMKSIDGFSWEPVPTATNFYTQMTTAYGMASDGSMNIVVGVNAGDSGGITRVLYASASNLTSWAETFYTSMSVDNTPRCIVYNGSTWVIGGDVPQLSYSLNGLDWDQPTGGSVVSSTSGNPILSIAWTGAFFAAVGASYTTTIPPIQTIYRRYYSTDGITWFNSGSSSPAIDYTCVRSNNIWKTPPTTFSSTDLLTRLAANGGLTALASYIGKQSATYL